MKKLAQLFGDPRNAGSTPITQKLHLAAFVLIPPPTFPTSSIANISSPDWSDVLNNYLLAPFTTLQAFLPLLSSETSSVLFLNSSITPSLASPSHAPENVIFGAMDKYISTLRQEFTTINVVQLKLGLFDYGNFSEERKQLVPAHTSSIGALYDPKSEERIGTSLRDLHNNVFDVIVREKARNGTVFVGKGSRLYDFVGNWMPSNFVNSLMNMSKGQGPLYPRRESEGSLEASSEWEKLQ